MSDDPATEDGAEEIPDRTVAAPDGTVAGELPPAARRALAEAEARRRAAPSGDRPREIGGRGGPEPTRYGDWEKDGIAHDF